MWLKEYLQEADQVWLRLGLCYGNSGVPTLSTILGRLCAGLASLLLCAASPTKAQHDAPNLEVAWSAPPECPDRDDLLRMLRERLPERRAAIDLRARVQIVRRGAEFLLTLELESRGAHASRRLTHQQCAPLAEAAAVLIVFAIETEAENAALPAESDTAPSTPLAASEAVAPSPPYPILGSQNSQTPAQAPSSLSPPATRRSDAAPEQPESAMTQASNAGVVSPLHLQLSAAARAGLGTFPHRPALGVQAQLALRIAGWSIALGATYWPQREHSSPTYPGARLRGSGMFSDLALGLDVTTRPIVVTPAFNLELGQLSAEALGIQGPELNRIFWLAAGPSASISVNLLNDWAVALELAGLISVFRTRWLVRTPEGDVAAFVAAPVAWRLSFRIGYRLH